MTTLRVDRAAVLAHRARASHLDAKLAPDGLAAAAWGGLQDTAPRAAVVSLHARVSGVRSQSWDDPSLVQIWGPRGADYVVPRADVDVFTIGRLPRDPEQCRRLDALADEVHRVLEGATLEVRDVSKALPELGHRKRLTSITGRVHIRWDASRIWAIPVDRPTGHPEVARLELARRFLHWFAPVTLARYAWWAGIEPADAKRTWSALAEELVDVDVGGEPRCVLARDVDALAGAEPVAGARLLPHGDPLLKIDGELVVTDPALRFEIFPRQKSQAAFWPVSGGLLVNGEIVGSWARQQRRVTVHPWRKLPLSVCEAIESEALSFPIAGSREPQVVWA